MHTLTVEGFLALSIGERATLKGLTLLDIGLKLDRTEACLEALAKCTELTELELKIVNICSFNKKALEALSNAIPQLKKLQILNIYAGDLGVLDRNKLEIIVNALIQCKTLQKLRFIRTLNLIKQENLTILKKVFMCENLQELDVSGIWHHEGNFEAFFPDLKQCTALQTLHMFPVWCDISSFLSREQFNLLKKTIEPLECLTEIIGHFTDEQKNELNKIFDRNKEFLKQVKGIPPILNTALTSIPSPLHEIILHYIAPVCIFSQLNKAINMNPQESQDIGIALPPVPPVAIHCSHETQKTAITSPVKNRVPSKPSG